MNRKELVAAVHAGTDGLRGDVGDIYCIFFNEWAQIAAISENLNWCSAWSAPEYRIGTYALSPHKVRKNQGLIAAASGDRALPGDYPFSKQHAMGSSGKVSNRGGNHAGSGYSDKGNRLLQCGQGDPLLHFRGRDESGCRAVRSNRQ